MSKEKGIQQVSESNAEWLHKANLLFVRYLKLSRYEPFSSCDFRLWANQVHKLGEPNHPNAWGALFNAAFKQGVIVPTGGYEASIHPKAHGRMIRLWKRF